MLPSRNTMPTAVAWNKARYWKESEEMATLSEAHALQQEAGEEEAHTADEMVEAAPPEAPQTKSSQDGVEAMEGHVKA